MRDMEVEEGIIIGVVGTIAGLTAIYYGRRALLNWGPVKRRNEEKQARESLKQTSDAYIEAIKHQGDINQYGYPDDHPQNWIWSRGRAIKPRTRKINR